MSTFAYRRIGRQAPKVTIKTPEQRLAFEAFELASQKERAFLDSPFVNPHGEQKYKAATDAALRECKLAGLFLEEAATKTSWASVRP